MNIENLTASQLRQAADLKEQIEALNLELEQITGKSDAVNPVVASVLAKKRGRPRKEVASVVVQAQTEEPKRGPKKGGMSAEGRAKIAAAQIARWAKVNAAKTEPIAEKVVEAVKSASSKPKRKMSAAGKAAIAAGAKARWAKVRAGKK